MNRKTRRVLAITEIIAGGTFLTTLLGLFGTVGGMEQGSIGFGEGCIRAAVLLVLFCAAVIAEDAAHRYREAHRQSGQKRGENRI